MRKQINYIRIVRWIDMMVSPCKSCLVKPMCHETCDANREYHQFRYNLINVRRIIYEMGIGFLSFGMFALILWMIFGLEW